MRGIFTAIGLSVITTSALAQDVGITQDMMSITVETPSGQVEIMRNQDSKARLAEPWTKTSRPCPNFCIQPLVPAPGDTPVVELEVLNFLESGEALLVDGRIRASSI